MIVSSCPTRISLGSADHHPFAERFGGIALNFCIDKKIYVIIRKRTRLEKEKFRISYSKTELCSSVDDITLDPVREALKMVGLDTPLEIIYASDVPARLGLATSSAFILALLKGLYYLRNTSVSPEILAEKAFTLERELLKQAGGFQDHYIGWGGINFLRGSPHRVTREAIVLTPEQIREFENHFFLIYTGDQGDSEKILPEQLEKLARGKTLDDTIKIKSLVHEMYSAMLKPTFHPMDLAVYMNEQWELKKKLSTTMTNPVIDHIEQAVKGACPQSGIRLIGSGGRGFMLVLVPQEMRDKLIEALPGFKTATFSIDQEGCRVTGHTFLGA
jgi:D-glycero-alpha-D-manno-heptose-7-phosphate kinase